MENDSEIDSESDCGAGPGQGGASRKYANKGNYVNVLHKVRGAVLILYIYIYNNVCVCVCV